MKNLVVFLYGVCLLSLISYAECGWFKFSTKCKADRKEPWSYRGDNGPKFWGERYPTCNGREQSPIAISSIGAVHDDSLPKLSMDKYDVPVSEATVVNNGHTIEVEPSDGVQRTIFVNGDTYNLLQLHFHWGDAYYHGSEHTLDGVQYAMELHFVHRNANNQIAVVGVFFQEQSQDSPELQKIIETFPKVKYNATRTRLQSNLNLSKLLPANPSSFYRYPGSLTTPGCAEGVTWSVLTRPMPVGIYQMDEFRKLYSARKANAAPGCRLSNNYRRVQPLNHRTVILSL